MVRRAYEQPPKAVIKTRWPAAGRDHRGLTLPIFAWQYFAAQRWLRHPPIAAFNQRKRENRTMDIVFVGLTAVLLALTLGLIRVCERV
jgi:hypothetical protein